MNVYAKISYQPKKDANNEIQVIPPYTTESFTVLNIDDPFKECATQLKGVVDASVGRIDIFNASTSKQLFALDVKDAIQYNLGE